MKIERIENPSSPDRAAIEASIAAGSRVILQFGKPCYTPQLIKRINNLCGEFGKNLEVRFYGHYQTEFDCSILFHLPDVASLSVDCLFEATKLSFLNDLANLRCLSLGIYKLDDPNILKSLQLQNIERLVVSETAKANIDLAPLETCNRLAELFLVGHTKNIRFLSNLAALRKLSLGHIPKKQSLEFISKIQSLRHLIVILGGRENLSEIEHSSLEELEVLRVLGFNSIDSIEAFPALRSLVIEDQIRLKSVRFSSSSKHIQSLRIQNCKSLGNLEGLNHLTNLTSIRIGMTALDIDSILQQRLAASLQMFSFFTGGQKKNDEIRKKLNSRGYRECSWNELADLPP